jgi:hypothetical protein
MQRREAEIGLRDRERHQRPKERNDTGENPPEMARFESVWKCAVLKDWMVVSAVICEPVSAVSTLFFPVLPCSEQEMANLARCGAAIDSQPPEL